MKIRKTILATAILLTPLFATAAGSWMGQEMHSSTSETIASAGSEVDKGAMMDRGKGMQSDQRMMHMMDRQQMMERRMDMMEMMMDRRMGMMGKHECPMMGGSRDAMPGMMGPGMMGPGMHDNSMMNERMRYMGGMSEEQQEQMMKERMEMMEKRMEMMQRRMQQMPDQDMEMRGMPRGQDVWR